MKTIENKKYYPTISMDNLQIWAADFEFRSNADFKNEAEKYNKISTKDRIPTDADWFKKKYGITIGEFIGTSYYLRNYLPLENLLTLIEKECIISLKDFDDFVIKFNLDHSKTDKLEIPKSRGQFYRIYGINIGKLIGITNNYEYFSLDEIKKMCPNIKNGQQLFRYAKILNRNQIKSGGKCIPTTAVAFKRVYGINVGEFYSTTSIIYKISLHLEDLYLLDKTQLLQIAFLKKLPKDIYEEILECPKGVERKRLLEDLPDRLETIKDGKDLTTFENSLDEVIEVTKKVQDEEEKGFKEELKIGVDFAEKPSEFNPENKLKEILGGITALGNFNDGDYAGCFFCHAGTNQVPRR